MDLMTVMLQAAAPAGGGSASFLIMMVLIFAVMYFFMIRPQQKRQKELVKFRNALEKGQKIITAGGIYGTIKEVKETYVLVEVDSNVAIRVDKNMVMKACENGVRTTSGILGYFSFICLAISKVSLLSEPGIQITKSNIVIPNCFQASSSVDT